MNDLKLVNILKLIILIVDPTLDLIQVLVFVLWENEIVNLLLYDPPRGLRNMPIPFLIYKLNFQVIIKFKVRIF